jgi:hypothetical protein
LPPYASSSVSSKQNYSLGKLIRAAPACNFLFVRRD